MCSTWSQFFYSGADSFNLSLLDGLNWYQWESELLTLLDPLSFVAGMMQAPIRRRRGPLYSAVIDQELFIFLTRHLKEDIKSIAMDIRAQYGLKGTMLYWALKNRFEANIHSRSGVISISVEKEEVESDTSSTSTDDNNEDEEQVKSLEQVFEKLVLEKEENRDGDEIDKTKGMQSSNENGQEEKKGEIIYGKPANAMKSMSQAMVLPIPANSAKEQIQTRGVVSQEEIFEPLWANAKSTDWDEESDGKESDTQPIVVLDIKKKDLQYEMKFRVWPEWKNELLQILSKRGNAVSILTEQVSKGDAQYNDKLDQDLFQMLKNHFPTDSNVAKFNKLAYETVREHGYRESKLLENLDDYMADVELGRIQNFVNQNKVKDKERVFDLLEREFSSAYDRFGVTLSKNDKLDYYAEALNLDAALVPDSTERLNLKKEFNALSKSKAK